MATADFTEQDKGINDAVNSHQGVKRSGNQPYVYTIGCESINEK